LNKVFISMCPAMPIISLGMV